jgi:hypothetical protein
MSTESMEDSEDTSGKEEQCFTYNCPNTELWDGYHCGGCEELFCSVCVELGHEFYGKFYCYDCYWLAK